MTQIKTSPSTALVCRSGYNNTAFLAGDIADFMKAYIYDGPECAADWAGECGCHDGNWNIWKPLIDIVNKYYEAESLAEMLDHPTDDPMDWL